MNIVLDSGGVSHLASDRAKLEALMRRGAWPARVPSAVLTEALTGDHRRDHAVNRFLKTCEIVDVDELTARSAARLRTATGRAGTISAVDAIVAAFAESTPDSAVVTTDPTDITALASGSLRPFQVLGV